MADIDKVLFICMDNTCRSIMAEAVMKFVCRDLPIRVCSRGLVVLFSEPLNPKAVAILKSNKLSPAKESTEGLEKADITDTTLVLTMTEHGCSMVKERFPEAKNVYALGSYAGRPCDIDDPHGGSLADYGACYEYIDLMVKLAAEKLFHLIQIDR